VRPRACTLHATTNAARTHAAHPSSLPGGAHYLIQALQIVGQPLGVGFIAVVKAGVDRCHGCTGCPVTGAPAPDGRLARRSKPREEARSCELAQHRHSRALRLEGDPDTKRASGRGQSWLQRWGICALHSEGARVCGAVPRWPCPRALVREEVTTTQAEEPLESQCLPAHHLKKEGWYKSRRGQKRLARLAGHRENYFTF
jgi:hypothetical protein